MASKDVGRLQAAEIRFLRALKNVNIRRELGVESIMQNVINYRENWELRIERMADERIPKQIMK
jgi:hypothetical protein